MGCSVPVFGLLTVPDPRVTSVALFLYSAHVLCVRRSGVLGVEMKTLPVNADGYEHTRWRHGLAPGKAGPAEVGSSVPNLQERSAKYVVPLLWPHVFLCLPVRHHRGAMGPWDVHVPFAGRVTLRYVSVRITCTCLSSHGGT